jgi:hypothetical protein
MPLGVGFGGIGLQGGARTVGDLTAGPLTLTDDANAGGNYLLNDQTTTNMMSKGTVYKFIATSPPPPPKSKTSSQAISRLSGSMGVRQIW